MSNNFLREGRINYPEDIVEFGIFRHVSGLKERRRIKMEGNALLLSLGTGYLSRVVFAPCLGSYEKKQVYGILYVESVN